VKDVFGNAGLMKLVILNFFYQTGDYGYTVAADHSEGVNRRQHGQRWLPGGAAVCRRWPGSM
jgi:hypothetical protein